MLQEGEYVCHYIIININGWASVCDPPGGRVVLSF